MTTLHAGIDEAGYGPLLGPLSIVAACAEVAPGVDPAAAFAAAGVEVGDSKRIHTSGDLAPIESVALAGLAWLTGSVPATAAACFALLGEDEATRQDPWMGGASELRLPVAADRVAAWRLPGVQPHSVAGALVHPGALNQASGAGRNRADVELDRIGGLLRRLPSRPRIEITCDRLGGRRYYRDFLASVWPGSMVLVEGEAIACSSYRAMHAEGETRAAFLVDGELASPFVALASCIAKYARELHMLLLNRWWCDAVPGLRATAGYGSDAYRWLEDVGGSRLVEVRSQLIRQTAVN